MTFFQVKHLSKILESKNIEQYFIHINKYYKPKSIVDLILKVKNGIFYYTPAIPLEREIHGQSYNLSLKTNNFLLLNPIEDSILKCSFECKVNFPNMISLKDQNINIISIVKEVKIKDKWIKLNSYDKEEMNEFLSNIEIQDFKIIREHYDKLYNIIYSYYFIKLYNVEEKITLENIMSFIINTFHYEIKELYKIMMLGMRHFNLSYDDYKKIDIFELLYMSKTGQGLIKEEFSINTSGLLNKFKK